MQSVWFDFCDDDSMYGGFSSSGSYTNEAQPFYGIFSDEPMNLAESIPRPITPMPLEEIEYSPKIENQHYLNPCISESPPVPSSFAFESSRNFTFPHNYVSIF